MADQTIQRRLAAILAADVAGYTRLMEEDTDGTVAAWQDAREDVIKPSVGEFSGKIVKLTGDGFLVEFGTVRDAVNCAIAMQRGLASSSLDFRIGINLGDIIDDGEDIHGEGVNVAARLEGLAEPGGIVISGDVYNQVRNRIDADYRDMGLQEVKNVSAPVQAYSIQIEAAPHAAVLSAAEKPSIAVLPFDNLSGDPEQDFIGDGLTEDIIAGLSRIRSFFVIARNSTFQYKGTSPDIRRVAEELNVRYVLEGSVRKAGDRIRVTAQLIDAANNNHLWAERFDREFNDVFAVQDEITGTIVAQLEPELGRAEYERVKAEPPENLDAWGLYHRGLLHLSTRNQEEIIVARRLFEEAIDRDQYFSLAHAGVSWSYSLNALFGFSDTDRETAMVAAQQAIKLDVKECFARMALGWFYIVDRQSDIAIHELEEAILNNPSNAQAHNYLGFAYLHTGQAEKAIPQAELAMSLSPADPVIGVFYVTMSIANLYLKQHGEAVEWAKKAIQKVSTWNPRAFLTAALSHLERHDEALRACEELQANHPGICLDFVRNHIPTIHQPYVDHLVNGLRKAGLPEN